MDLGSPLASLMNPLESAALTVLARADADFTGRGVARLAGGQRPASVHAALRRLTEVGLVTADARPHAIMYRANRQHLLWPAVEVALGSRAELRRRLTAFCDSRMPLGVSVLLYGSAVRSDAGPGSDVDLAAVTPDGADRDAVDDFAFQLGQVVEVWTGNPAQVNVFPASDLRRHEQDGEALLASWAREGRVIAGSWPTDLPVAG